MSVLFQMEQFRFFFFFFANVNNKNAVSLFLNNPLDIFGFSINVQLNSNHELAYCLVNCSKSVIFFFFKFENIFI